MNPITYIIEKIRSTAPKPTPVQVPEKVVRCAYSGKEVLPDMPTVKDSRGRVYIIDEIRDKRKAK